MNQEYFGSTIIPGATYLDSKAMLSIEQGYYVGVTAEYVSIGDFSVNDMTHSADDVGLLDLSAYAPHLRTHDIQPFFDRRFKSHQFINTQMDYLDNALRDFEFTDTSIVSATTTSWIRLGQPTDREMFVYSDEPIRDFTLRTKMRANRTGEASNDSRPRIMFWVENMSALDADFRGMMVQVNSSLNNMVLLSNTQGSFSAEATAGYVAPANNEPFWLQLIVSNNNIKVYTSDDGYSFTQRINSTIYSALGKGLVGAGLGRSGASLTYDWSTFELAEIGGKQTKGDVLRSTYAMADIKGVSIQTEFGDFSVLEGNVGASWVVSGNELSRLDASGDVWDTYLTTGSTFVDYSFEVDVKGASGNKVMLIAGSTDNYYGTWGLLSPSANSRFEAMTGATSIQYGDRGKHINMREDTWYRMKLVKQGLILSTYVNNTLYDFGIASEIDSKTGGNKVGVAVNTDLGTSVTFRNPSISILDDYIEDAKADSGSDLENTINRYLPDGYETNWAGNHVEIFEAGTSRGTYDIGLSDVKSNPSRSIDNNVGVDVASAVPLRGFVTSVNNNERVKLQIDGGRAYFFTDLSIETVGDARKISRALHTQSNQDVNNVSLRVTPRLDIEKYDRVNLVDLTLGASGIYRVNNVDTTWDNNGAYRQTLKLYEDT